MTASDFNKNMRKALMVMLACIAPDIAFAAPTVGGTISGFGSNLEDPLLSTIVAISFALGLYLIGSGLLAVSDASSGNGQSQYRDGIKKMLGGSILMAIPIALGINVQTILGVSSYYGGSASAPVGAPQNCINSSSSAALTCVMKNISTNVVPIAVETAFVLCWVFAAALLATTIYQVSAAHQRGGDAPKHWKLNLIIIGILADFPFFMSSVESTLGITNQTVTSSGYTGLSGSNPSSMLAYQGGGGALAQYSQTIGYAFVVISMFGVFYTLYGIGILMSENPRGSKWSGIVHIIGGVALANPKYVTCFVINTLLGNTYGFCG